MNNKRVSNCFFYYIALVMSQLGISAAFMQNNSDNNFLRIAIVMVGMFLIEAILRNGKRLGRKEFFVVFSIVCAIFIIIIKMGYYGDLLLTGPLMCISCFFIMMALILNAYKFNYLLFFLINTIGSIILIFAVFTKSNDIWGTITIGYINPQTIGAWAMIYAIGTLIGFDFFIEKVKHKLLFVLFEMIIYILMIYITAITEARFSSLCLIALIVLRVLPPIHAIDNTVIRGMMVLLPIILLVLFEMIYLVGKDWGVGQSILNGRERIWLIWLENVSTSFLFGYDYRYIDANSFYSHNIFVDYLVLFGIIVPIVFWGVLGYIFIKKVPRIVPGKKVIDYSRIKYDAFLTFTFILVASFCEGCFFSGGGGGIFIYSFVPLLVVLSKEK